MSQRIKDWADIVYIPQNFDEIVGNAHAIEKFKRFAANKNWGNFPHLLVVGPPGTGKTVASRILAREIGAECRLWDTSDSGRLEVIQDDVINFAKTRAIDKDIKVAILDEIERFSPKAQDSLRGPLVKWSANCRFILISNNPATITDWVRSRCHLVRFFPLTPDEIYGRLVKIASAERLNEIITGDQLFGVATLAGGDMRNAIKNLQGLCQGRTKPVTDDEIEEGSIEQTTATIGIAMSQAFNGDFSDSVKTVDALLLSGVPPKQVYDTICNNIAYSNFSEQQKIVMGLAVSKISLADLTSRAQLYGILAFIADNRGG